jgi:hypothetical protein
MTGKMLRLHGIKHGKSLKTQRMPRPPMLTGWSYWEWREALEDSQLSKGRLEIFNQIL